MNIEELKKKISLPETARRLGIDGFPEGPGKMRSPIRAGDDNPSFSIWRGQRGELLWTDHGTKETGDQITLIQKMRGLSVKEAVAVLRDWAAPVTARREPGKLVAIYDYLDASGKLVHQTLRYDPKSFRQRRPAVEGEAAGCKKATRDRDGKWWLWSLAGIMPVLYRLPDILSRPEELVFIVEGEKDADAAAAAGLLATTCPMGAGKWRPHHSAALAGRRVCIVPDRDPLGRDHALGVARSLRGVACEVRVVDWDRLWPNAPEGKIDLSDYLKARGLTCNR